MNNQTCRCGVLVKSHPKSIIRAVYSHFWHNLFYTDNPTINDKPITILQVAPVSESSVFIEFVYNEDYTDGLKEQL